MNGAEAGGAPRAPPRESCTLSSATWPQPAGLHMGRAERWLVEGGWNREEWQRKRIPEPEAPKGPTKWTIAFEEECAAREAREKAVRFDSSTVYCAKHLYTLDNEMCSTCAKRGWRDVRCARSRPQTSPTLIVTRACQVRLPQGRVFHAHALRQWRHPSSQPCLEERIVQRVCRARGPGHLQVQGHGQV